MNRFSRPKMLFIILLISVMSLLSVGVVTAEFGVNWAGQFYNCIDLGVSCGNVVAQTGTFPTGINVNWPGQPVDGNGTTMTSVVADNFSVRFSSTQTFQDGNYDFRITAEDGVRLYVDGVLILDNFISRPLTTDTVSRAMTAGAHTLVVEYFSDTGTAVLQVEYFLGGTGTGTPAVSPVPVVTGQVVFVRGLSVRTSPFLGASLIAVARPDVTYSVLARNLNEGIYTWYLIQFNDITTGWVSGRYFQITGDVNIVPIIDSEVDIATASPPPDIGVRGITRAIMNFRVRPSVRNQRMSQIPWGDEVEILGRSIRAGASYWLLVRYEGQVGWIFAPFITIRGPIDAVRVY